ncbi:helix-turn-helix domain-containing protein [Nonomuraea jabiensis]|uniref:helix-turn-helix domain-containing protein n=1 Tax=Nonomuraea jabiensis TaxID=882448 RepID=UPI003D748655
MSEETFGQILRRLRMGADLTLRMAARRADVGKTTVEDLEKGRRGTTRRIAVALDKAVEANGEIIAAFERDETQGKIAKFPPTTAEMGSVPTLAVDDVRDEDGEEATKRRKLFRLAAGVGVLSFEEVVRQRLDLTTTPHRTAEDWDIARADHLHALRTRPPAQVVQDLSIDLYLLRQQMDSAADDQMAELHRVAAMLAAIQANALTRMSEHGSAIRWWSTAKKHADSSRDVELRLLVRGEEAIHGLYGQREPETVLRLIQNARHVIRRPWLRLIAAEAKALAVLGRPAEATTRLRDLHDNMDRGVTGDRWDFFRPDQIPFAESWVAAYAGDEPAADTARERVLKIIPERSYQYRVNARLHEAISTAALGGVDEGARIAAELIDSLPAAYRTNHIKETARMVVRAVPLDQQARPAVGELRSMLALEAG